MIKRIRKFFKSLKMKKNVEKDYGNKSIKWEKFAVEQFKKIMNKDENWVQYMRELYDILSLINSCIIFTGLKALKRKSFALLIDQAIQRVEVLEKIKIKNKRDKEIYTKLLSVAEIVMQQQSQVVLQLLLKQGII